MAVETESGQRYLARFVIDTSGVLANPHIPRIKGAEAFTGPMFHSGQRDHSVAYEGKRVAVIGSGCSAAQIVPAIADKVSRLTLFMGKAQWILPRSDRQYGAAERVVRTLPGIRHCIRWLVFALYDIRFIGFRRYPGMSGISRLIKDHYRRRLEQATRQAHPGRQAAPAHDARLRVGWPARHTDQHLPASAVA